MYYSFTEHAHNQQVSGKMYPPDLVPGNFIPLGFDVRGGSSTGRSKHRFLGTSILNIQDYDMHEGALTEDLFEHVIIHAREANARCVTRVRVSIGALSDATAESIQFYWNTMAAGTIAADAVLEFEAIPGQATCPKCAADFEIDELYAACPKCETFPVQVTGGNGVYLSSLEVETDDERHEQIHE